MKKITYVLFCPYEYLFGRNGKVYDENGLLFEDWTSEGSGKRDGMRMRVDDDWEDEWDLFKAVASGNAAFFKRKVSHFKKWG